MTLPFESVNPLRKWKAQKDFSFYKRFLKENAKSIFSLLSLGSFSFTGTVIVFYLFVERFCWLICSFRAVKLKIVFCMFIVWLSVKIIKIPLSRLIFLQGLRSLITKQQKSFRQTLHFDSGYGCYITKVLINLCKMSK